MGSTTVSGKQSIAVVIGASRGIGAAASQALARRGLSVVVAAPPGEDCESVVRAIVDAGGTAMARECDARDAASVDALMGDVVRQGGHLRALVNCAGIMGPVAKVEDTSASAWAECITVNLIGAYHGCRAVLPHFRRQGSGVIVNMSTGAAFHALEGWSAYCTSKAGLTMLTRIVAAEVSGSGICVYSFQPGMVNTDLGRESMRVDINRVTNLDPHSFTPPSEPGEAIAWLCATAPDDLVGKEIVVTDPQLRQRVGLPAATPPRQRQIAPHSR